MVASPYIFVLAAQGYFGLVVHTDVGSIEGVICYRSCILENDSRCRLEASFLMSNKMTSQLGTLSH